MQMQMQMQELAHLHDKDKQWHDFNAKENVDATSMQMQTLHSIMIRKIGVATLQRQIWNTFMQKQVLA